MSYTLACGDAVPGCSARFEEDSRERVMELVAVHAKDAHGVADLSPEMLDMIGAGIVSA